MNPGKDYIRCFMILVANDQLFVPSVLTFYRTSSDMVMKCVVAFTSNKKNNNNKNRHPKACLCGRFCVVGSNLILQSYNNFHTKEHYWVILESNRCLDYKSAL